MITREFFPDRDGSVLSCQLRLPQALCRGQLLGPSPVPSSRAQIAVRGSDSFRHRPRASPFQQTTLPLWERSVWETTLLVDTIHALCEGPGVALLSLGPSTPYGTWKSTKKISLSCTILPANSVHVY
jgi:hypothetical protein